ncbi:cuticle protein 14 isoform b-like protein [Leptotrombidium deliense]|uniref:Cuticle protein 14 isoform b-like protein n=1 Tax=Leptotrombidium deliense TaxID=299467 RepID=A0A443SR49_9ACAR|nr:cuticle protein 14 isoform b-like protein [Leptotrombidium deliense]
MKCLILLALTAIASAGYAPHAAIVNTGASSQFRSQDNIGNYEFGYDEKHATGGTFRREKGDKWGNKVGSYGLQDIDGRFRVVEYIADDFGFRANIKSNEPGVEPRDPAAVSLNKAPIAVAHKVIAAAPAIAAPVIAAPIAAPLHGGYGAGYGAAIAAPVAKIAAPIAVPLHTAGSISTYAKTVSTPVAVAPGPPVVATPIGTHGYGGHGLVGHGYGGHGLAGHGYGGHGLAGHGYGGHGFDDYGGGYGGHGAYGDLDGYGGYGYADKAAFAPHGYGYGGHIRK